MDSYISIKNDIALGKLGQKVNAEIPLTRISIYQVLGSSLFYNAQLQLIEFEKRSVTAQVFSKWMTDVQDHMSGGDARWVPRKLTVLGMSSILNIAPMSSLPPSIYPTQIPQLISFVVHLTEAMKNDAEKEDAEIAAAAAEQEKQKLQDQNKAPTTVTGNPGVDDEDDDDDDDDGSFGEDEDVTNEIAYGREACRKCVPLGSG